MVLSWNHFWSDISLIMYMLSALFFFILASRFLLSNRKEARAVGVLFMAGGIKSILYMVYYVFQDGTPAPVWIFAVGHSPVLISLFYLFYVITDSSNISKEK